MKIGEELEEFQTEIINLNVEIENLNTESGHKSGENQSFSLFRACILRGKVEGNSVHWVK